MRQTVSKAEEQKIYDFEAKMCELYRKIVNPYSQSVNNKGYVFHTGLKWRNSIRHEHSAARLSPSNGYECYFYCSIEKAGKVVCIESTDGEADYYPLEISTMVSMVSRQGFKLHVSLFADSRDFSVDLSDLILQLNQI